MSIMNFTTIIESLYACPVKTFFMVYCSVDSSQKFTFTSSFFLG